jgi:hypothetical protein
LPLLLLAPAIAWLVAFYVYPAIQMLQASLWSGTLETGFAFSWANAVTYSTALGRYSDQFLRSILYAAVSTVVCLALAFPLAYTIAYRAGRYRTLLLFIVIAPFFTSFLLRVLAWVCDVRFGRQPGLRCSADADPFFRHFPNIHFVVVVVGIGVRISVCFGNGVGVCYCDSVCVTLKHICREVGRRHGSSLGRSVVGACSAQVRHGHARLHRPAHCKHGLGCL